MVGKNLSSICNIELVVEIKQKYIKQDVSLNDDSKITEYSGRPVK